MTEANFSIAPSPELFAEWLASSMKTVGRTIPENDRGATGLIAGEVAIQAAHWGADQELMACINYFHEYDPSWGEDSELITGLRAARRPKPLSLKEQALQELDLLKVDASTHGLGFDSSAIRRALESLPS